MRVQRYAGVRALTAHVWKPMDTPTMAPELSGAAVKVRLGEVFASTRARIQGPVSMRNLRGAMTGSSTRWVGVTGRPGRLGRLPPGICRHCA
jgi:hypothetical protein